jgi:hypothetical protein
MSGWLKKIVSTTPPVAETSNESAPTIPAGTSYKFGDFSKSIFKSGEKIVSGAIEKSNTVISEASAAITDIVTDKDDEELPDKNKSYEFGDLTRSMIRKGSGLVSDVVASANDAIEKSNINSTLYGKDKLATEQDSAADKTKHGYQFGDITRTVLKVGSNVMYTTYQSASGVSCAVS